MNKKVLIIIRGAPAAGKSTLAKNLVKFFKHKSKTALLVADEFKWTMTSHDHRISSDFKLAFSNYQFALKNYLTAGYAVITEDTWDRPPFETVAVAILGQKHKYTVHQFLLKGAWTTIQHQNTLRPMIITPKQLQSQYKSIYSKKLAGEIIIEIDRKTPNQIAKEVLKHINS